ncbi:Clavaminate synthase-like protein [Lojkania enalia]|uniref:Clavaminate synthase-like protein n=1 Tax=Lojkania enalia TaxID=147567 RepID=A0A9P4JX32_9PLEO|nr:Clavaminate synthase-like protein [Didymosphaeria enalia]
MPGRVQDDTAHVEFSRRLGELDDIRPYMKYGRKMRYEYYELFDAGNIDESGNIIDPNSAKAQHQNGNGLFHVDSSFNPRRASHSLLRAYALPLPENDYTAAHCMAHSRKLGAPDFFKDLDVESQPMHFHKIVQLHELSKRMNLYISAHAHHIVGLPKNESDKLLKELMEHATQEKYRISVPWENETDMIIWDNTCMLHRAGSGTYTGKFKRDLRRTTVHDDSSTAWGLNEKDVDKRPGFSLGASN